MSDLSGAHFSQAEAQQYAQQLSQRGFAPVKYGNDDDSCAPKFYMRSVPDPQASIGAGREVHRMEEFLRIDYPGGKTVYDQPATDDKRKRFWRHYEAFKANNQKPEIVGTPLEIVPWLTAAEVDDLRAFRVYSLEQLAALSDQQIGVYGPLGRQYRERAQAVMKAGTEAAPLLALQKQIEALQIDNEMLRAQFKKMHGEEPDLSRPIDQPKRRGRPPRTQTTGEAA